MSILEREIVMTPEPEVSFDDPLMMVIFPLDGPKLGPVLFSWEGGATFRSAPVSIHLWAALVEIRIGAEGPIVKNGQITARLWFCPADTLTVTWDMVLEI